MRVTIIGWYGTETIGDRAILAGILKTLTGSCEHVSLGSLYPFFTERTLSEDVSFYEKTFGFKGKIALFDSKKSFELRKNIDESDILIMGGGPLMHISPLYMIDYAFKYARKVGTKTVVLGCGIGPIFHKKYSRLLFNILSYSERIVLRDSASIAYINELFNRDKKTLDTQKIKLAYDPSVLTCIAFKKNLQRLKKNQSYDLVINLREFPKEYLKDIKNLKNIKKNMDVFMAQIESFSKKTLMLPNHYFFCGEDDRDYYNKLKFQGYLKNIDIQNKPLSLEETMETISSSKKCIGMRFHSVVFQTLLNSNNFVLDYTEPTKGKVYGFLKDIDFNFDNYINIQAGKVPKLIKFAQNKKLDLEEKRINNLYLFN